MLAVDSNILAYLLIEGPRTVDARSLFGLDPDWHVDEFALVELSNILATAVRLGQLDLGRAEAALSEAQSVVEGAQHGVTHAEALALAERYRVTAYDARHLGVALALGVPLVTEDRKLRKAAPAMTRSLAEAIGAH